MHLRQLKLQRRLSNGYVDVLGVPVQSLDFDTSVSLKGNEFFADGEGRLCSVRQLKSIFCDQTIYHVCNTIIL